MEKYSSKNKLSHFPLCFLSVELLSEHLLIERSDSSPSLTFRRRASSVFSEKRCWLLYLSLQRWQHLLFVVGGLTSTAHRENGFSIQSGKCCRLITSIAHSNRVVAVMYLLRSPDELVLNSRSRTKSCFASTPRCAGLWHIHCTQQRWLSICPRTSPFPVGVCDGDIHCWLCGCETSPSCRSHRRAGDAAASVTLVAYLHCSSGLHTSLEYRAKSYEPFRWGGRMPEDGTVWTWSLPLVCYLPYGFPNQCSLCWCSARERAREKERERESFF